MALWRGDRHGNGEAQSRMALAKCGTAKAKRSGVRFGIGVVLICPARVQRCRRSGAAERSDRQGLCEVGLSIAPAKMGVVQHWQGEAQYSKGADMNGGVARRQRGEARSWGDVWHRTAWAGQGAERPGVGEAGQR
jgi:hypothetical protein